MVDTYISSNTDSDDDIVRNQVFKYCKPPLLNTNTCLITQNEFTNIFNILGDIHVLQHRHINNCDDIENYILPNIKQLIGWKISRVLGIGAFGIVFEIYHTHLPKRVIKIIIPDTELHQSIEIESEIQRILYRRGICPQLYHSNSYINKSHRTEREIHIMITEHMDMTLTHMLKCIDYKTYLNVKYIQFISSYSRPNTYKRAFLIFVFFYMTKRHQLALLNRLMSYENTIEIHHTKLDPRYLYNINVLFENYTSVREPTINNYRQRCFQTEFENFVRHIRIIYNIQLDKIPHTEITTIVAVIYGEFLNLMMNRYDQLAPIVNAIRNMLYKLQTENVTHGDMHSSNMMVSNVGQIQLKLIDFGMTSIYNTFRTILMDTHDCDIIDRSDSCACVSRGIELYMSGVSRLRILIHISTYKRVVFDYPQSIRISRDIERIYVICIYILPVVLDP